MQVQTSKSMRGPCFNIRAKIAKGVPTSTARSLALANHCNVSSPATMESPRAAPYETAPPTKQDEARHEGTTMNDPAMFTTGKWEVALDDWTAHHCIPSVCMASCLPCVSLAQISVRINAGTYQKTLWLYGCLNLAMDVLLFAGLVIYITFLDKHDGADNSKSIITASSLFAIGVVCAIVLCVFISKLRTKVRARFQIDGSKGGDDYAAFCCTACAVSQMAVQVKSFTPGKWEFAAPEELPAYIP